MSKKGSALKDSEDNQNSKMVRAICFSLLVFALLLSAITIVSSVHQNRLLFAELQRLRQGADESRVEWGKLLLEQSSYAAYSRIESLANRKLQMKAPGSDEVVMVEQ